MTHFKSLRGASSTMNSSVKFSGLCSTATVYQPVENLGERRGNDYPFRPDTTASGRVPRIELSDPACDLSSVPAVSDLPG